MMCVRWYIDFLKRSQFEDKEQKLAELHDLFDIPKQDEQQLQKRQRRNSTSEDNTDHSASSDRLHISAADTTNASGSQPTVEQSEPSIRTIDEIMSEVHSMISRERALAPTTQQLPRDALAEDETLVRVTGEIYDAFILHCFWGVTKEELAAKMITSARLHPKYPFALEGDLLKSVRWHIGFLERSQVEDKAQKLAELHDLFDIPEQALDPTVDEIIAEVESAALMAAKTEAAIADAVERNLQLPQILFQTWRWVQYDKLYKPELGPEFSRWLEYFFTSPLQILIVSSAFGFATVDSLLGQIGMQAALVLLGYDIERQVKKMYKRLEKEKRDGAEYHSKHKRFHHIFSGIRIADIRLWVYLFFAWALHIAIWGIPYVTGFGIGGKYFLLQQQLEKCVKTMTIPDAITWIYWLQFVLFTLFGLVCTAHVVFVKNINVFKPDPKRDWRRISGLYTILSVTAKTLLEVGLVLYITSYNEWTDLTGKEANTEKLVQNNKSCWAINPVSDL
jgi:hypothetical protein